MLGVVAETEGKGQAQGEQTDTVHFSPIYQVGFAQLLSLFCCLRLTEKTPGSSHPARAHCPLNKAMEALQMHQIDSHTSNLSKVESEHHIEPKLLFLKCTHFETSTWLDAMGELFFTHSSTIFTTARRTFGSGDFSIKEVRITWMKFFLISMFITDSLVFTRSRLSMTSSLVTETQKHTNVHQ